MRQKKIHYHPIQRTMSWGLKKSKNWKTNSKTNSNLKFEFNTKSAENKTRSENKTIGKKMKKQDCSLKSFLFSIKKKNIVLVANGIAKKKRLFFFFSDFSSILRAYQKADFLPIDLALNVYVDPFINDQCLFSFSQFRYDFVDNGHQCRHVATHRKAEVIIMVRRSGHLQRRQIVLALPVIE